MLTFCYDCPLAIQIAAIHQSVKHVISPLVFFNFLRLLAAIRSVPAFVFDLLLAILHVRIALHL